MTALYQLQRDFLAAIYGAASAAPFLGHIHAHQRVAPITQFTLYRNSITRRLQKALKAIYPVCYQLVGHDFFLQMVACYIERTPSYTCDLNAYGDSLPDFIRDYAHAQSLPYLADVAVLEWAWHRLYGAPDTKPFDFQTLAALSAVSGEEIQFLLPPRASLLTSPYPIHSIWENNQKENTKDATLTLESNQTYYVYVWQQEHEFRIQRITATEWQVLTWFQQNLAFGTVCEYATAVFPDLNLAAVLPEFVKSGWITLSPLI